MIDKPLYLWLIILLVEVIYSWSDICLIKWKSQSKQSANASIFVSRITVSIITCNEFYVKFRVCVNVYVTQF